MTEERKREIFNTASQGFIRGVTRSECIYLEKEYGIFCDNYNCASCVLKFIKRCYEKEKNKEK